MKYRIAFFLAEVALLVQVTFYTLERMRGYAEAYAQLGDLFCPIGPTGPPVFVLLIALNLVLFALYFWPENDFLWWLNLVGLLSLAIGVFFDLNIFHLLMALSIIFGLAYRRHLGLKHIWHWRGMLAVGAAFVFGGVLLFLVEEVFI
jgi:hypothetical protein